MVEPERLFFYEALLQQLVDDGFEDAVALIESKYKVKPNSMLRKDHLFDIFNKCGYLSSRVLLESKLNEEEDVLKCGKNRVREVLSYTNVPVEMNPDLNEVAYKIMAEILNHKPSRCVAQSHDCSLVAVGGVSGSLRVIPFINVLNKREKRKPNTLSTNTLSGHIEQVDALDFHPRKNILASGGIDNTIIFHDINTSNGFIYSTSEMSKECMKFHPCGDFLFAGTSNSIIRLYDVVTSKCYTSSKTTHQHKGGGINGCDFNLLGSLLFTAGSDGSILIWDSKNLECIYSMDSAHNDLPVISIKCDVNNHYLLSSGLNGITKLYDLRMLKEVIDLLFIDFPDHELWS
ncbi:cleavage stimulation factor subunit 1, putative [Theileria annulata]|uniref:Cleavage stimulation factor 50 kDa subunit n=1 Tax=Theileria annulata TaxID=5874 RepID=Q4UF16_THEAN|nr:cleavage stimulation factor subunit 1, putative [Theileria annulata]CAI74323.1 cleavage stimulation factor subunit 1, putative [Theileria annulata]|eukprot:XP_952055.1 cleavage stimulation factor subunit 1, putative [Theileria annulata]